MKTAKKLTALLIVLTLLFSLSATAFAQGTYTIDFYDTGVKQTSWTLTPNAGVSVYNAIHNSTLNDVFYDVPDYYNPEIHHKVLDSINGIASDYATYADIPVSYTSVYNNITATSNPYYFLLETNNGSYHYLYLGYAWTYHYHGGGDLFDYMDVCWPTAGSTIDVEYSLQASDFWSNSVI